MNINLNNNRFGSATVTLPSDTEISIVRRFDAPAALVFECWTTPEHVRHWWGWETSTFVVCENDLSVGGAWRYVVHDEHGKEFGWHGTNLEIDAPHRLVATEVFEGFPDAAAVNTMTLSEDDGVTTFEAIARHSCKEHRDGHLNSGMEAGMQHTMDRLERLLGSLAAEKTRS